MAKNKFDPFFRLKHIAYVMGVGAPRGKGDLEDAVQNCKFQLCNARGYLMEDPIWDKYTDEQIMIEYFAMEFRNNAEFRKDFERLVPGYGIDSVAEDFLEWADERLGENQKELEKKAEEKIKELGMDEQEGFDFSPTGLGDM